MPAPRKRPRIIAVTGGKGGVGKSTVAANLALALGRLGHRTVIIDADLGAANLHTMMGVLRPSTGLADFLDKTVDRLDDVELKLGLPGVSLIAGTSRPGAANLASGPKLRLLRAIAKLDTDCVIVDVGAGTSFNVIDLVAAADLKVFVLTPHLPSLHNAYAQLKAIVHRVVRRLASDDVGESLVDSALGHETKARTIPQLLDVVEQLDAPLADGIRGTLRRLGVGIVANQLDTPADAAAIARMVPLMYDQLGVRAPVLAEIRRVRELAGGLSAGGRTLAPRGDETASAFRTLAQAVLAPDLATLRGEAPAMRAGTIPLWIARALEADLTDPTAALAHP
ncbi:MAG TPA: P-loop NTPase [Kofleriaceae bacterium]|jgi:flagellar biosynthesis protein FlhG